VVREVLARHARAGAGTRSDARSTPDRVTCPPSRIWPAAVDLDAGEAGLKPSQFDRARSYSSRRLIWSPIAEVPPLMGILHESCGETMRPTVRTRRPSSPTPATARRGRNMRRYCERFGLDDLTRRSTPGDMINHPCTSFANDPWAGQIALARRSTADRSRTDPDGASQIPSECGLVSARLALMESGSARNSLAFPGRTSDGRVIARIPTEARMRGSQSPAARRDGETARSLAASGSRRECAAPTITIPRGVGDRPADPREASVRGFREETSPGDAHNKLNDNDILMEDCP